jgi:hypothetical protein
VFLSFLSTILYLVPLIAGSVQRLLSPTRAPQGFSDASDISRELLYHPGQWIEFAGEAVVVRAPRFTYRFDRNAQRWDVLAEDNRELLPPTEEVEEYEPDQQDALFQFFGEVDGDEAVLEIHRSVAEGGFEVIARLRLWNRARLAEAWLAYFREDAPGLTAAELAEDLSVARPEVAAVAEDGSYLWLAIRHYAGEGVLGLGTVIRLDTTTGDTKVFQPAELRTSSVTHVAVFSGMVWLGTMRWSEGYQEPTAGLVRMHPETGATVSYRSGKTPGFAGYLVTALAADESELWAGTDEGICRLGAGNTKWKCWRILPSVTLAATVPVSDFPDGPPTRQLPPGSYEIRWATAEFLEVITPDAVEGWARDDDVAGLEARKFHTAAYELTNTDAGGAGVLLLLPTPIASPLKAAQVIRAPAERIGRPDSDGWQRCRAHVGWISRKGADVAPRISPVSE